MIKYCILNILLLGLFFGCGNQAGHENATADPVERQVVPISWEIQWSRGSASDTVLLMPVRLAADDSFVYAFDAGNSRIVAFHARSGEVAWTAGRRGGGPGEYRQVTGLAPIPGGGLLVVDGVNRRLDHFTQAGDLVRSIPLPNSLTAGGICPLNNGQVILGTAPVGSPLLRGNLQGDTLVLGEMSFPWEELITESRLLTQGYFVAHPDGSECVIALVLGEGFATLTYSDHIERYRYIESVALPTVDRVETSSGFQERIRNPRTASSGVGYRGDTLVVGWNGSGEYERKLLDLYGPGDRRYLHSYSSPVRIYGLATAGDFFAFITDLEDDPQVVVARPTN